MPRVSFMPLGSTLWFAGVTYLENLFEALDEAADCDLERVLFVDESSKPELTARVCAQAEVVVRHPPPPTGEAGSKWRREALARANVDVAFEIYGDHFSEPSAVPRIGWITDFQHLHLPELSLPRLVEQRDRACRITARNATRLVVSSHDALRDLAGFDATAALRADVMQFVARVPTDVYRRDPAWVAEHYHLPPKFIYLPNQCWKHKDHTTAVRALGILRARGVHPFIVCTGNTIDHRDRLHFARMLEEISRTGVRDQIAFLGMVPHDAVYALMRQSAFVLNPSLFEGWSTTVEEAKSLGKGIVLSDLPVHLEQEPPAADFFARGDAHALAEVLERRWRCSRPGPDLTLEQRAFAELPERMLLYGSRFADIVDATARAAQ